MSGIKLDTRSMPKKIKTKKFSAASFIVITTLCLSGLFAVLGITDYMKLHNMTLLWDVILGVADDTEDMDDMVLIDDDGNEMVVENSDETTAENPLLRFINFAGLKEINEDVSGYIYIPGTNVDYPILKETVKNVFYYQTHNIYKEQDVYGSVFELADEQIGDNSPVSWLFGHHMSTQEMFTPILEFEKQENVDTPIYVYREDYRTQYKIAAVCVVDKHDMIYNFDSYDKSNTESYQVLLDHIAATNEVTTDVELNVNTDILVLSTCKGRAGTSTRCCVVCVPYYSYRVDN